MKRFDVMKWLRKVRDEDYRRHRGMTPEQIIEDARKGAAEFRAMMEKRRAKQKRGARHRPPKAAAK